MKHIMLPILLTAILVPSFSAQAERTISFTPPQLGAPDARVGGGTRGFDLKSIERKHSFGAQEHAAGQIQLLASNKTGLSSSPTPNLYWYASSVPPYDVEITVQQGDNKPVLKKNIGMIKSPGIQTIRLADYGVKLTDGQDYAWSITLIADPKQRSADLLADAGVRYQKNATPLTDVTQMTAAGYWYDAVNELIQTKSPQLQDVLVQEGISVGN